MNLRNTLLGTTALIASTLPSVAISGSQFDDFETPSDVEGWGGGSGGAGTQTINQIATGGAGDALGYLSISQTSWHLGTNNATQWAGDYLAAGVTSIEMDLNSFSFSPAAGPANPLIYITLTGPGGTWASSTPISLTIAGGWQHASFGITPPDLTYLSGGTNNLNATLSAVTTLLIRHDYSSPSNPGIHPPHVTAVLGIDNITAVPEPSTYAILLGSIVGLMAIIRRRCR